MTFTYFTKSRHRTLRAFRHGCIGLLGIVFALQVATGCGTKKPIQKPLGDGPVDAKNDLVAVLSGGSNVLCVHPQEVDRALATLGAKLQDDGTYSAQVTNAVGEPEPVRFETVITEHPYICSSLYKDEYKKVSPIADLVAFIPKSGDRLCVHPEHKEQVLKMLQAEAKGDGRYVAPNPAGDQAKPFEFMLKTTLAPINCGGDDGDKPKPPGGAGGQGGSGGAPASGGSGGMPGSGAVVGVSGNPNVGGNPAVGGSAGSPGTHGEPGYDLCDPPDPRYRECEDGGGWFSLPIVLKEGIYTVYDEAECQPITLPDQCIPKPDGTSEMTKYDPYGICSQGQGYCVAVNSIHGKTFVYPNPTCTPPASNPGEPTRADVCHVLPNPNPPGALGGETAAANDRFRLYRNSQCGPWKPAETGDCVDSKDRKLGRYSLERWNDHPACRKGRGYCVETQLRVGTREYYDLRNGDACATKVNEEPLEAPACKP